jgi:conjugal transfer pilus assembly protein TrbC
MNTRSHLVTLSLGIAVLYVTLVAAEGVKTNPPSMPTEKELSQELKKVEQERKTLFDDPSLNDLSSFNRFPDVPRSQQRNVDPLEIAKRYEETAAQRVTEGLLVFVSFSMGDEALRKAIHDVSLVGGTAVLRGFKDDDIKKTAAAIAALKEKSGNVQINPNAFIKYKVQTVPTVVLVTAEGGINLDSQGCALPDKFIKVSGDVTLAYALEQIATKSPKFGAMATRFARPLKGSGS